MGRAQIETTAEVEASTEPEASGSEVLCWTGLPFLCWCVGVFVVSCLCCLCVCLFACLSACLFVCLLVCLLFVCCVGGCTLLLFALFKLCLPLVWCITYLRLHCIHSCCFHSCWLCILIRTPCGCVSFWFGLAGLCGVLCSRLSLLLWTCSPLGHVVVIARWLVSFSTFWLAVLWSVVSTPHALSQLVPLFLADGWILFSTPYHKFICICLVRVCLL